MRRQALHVFFLHVFLFFICFFFLLVCCTLQKVQCVGAGYSGTLVHLYVPTLITVCMRVQ